MELPSLPRIELRLDLDCPLGFRAVSRLAPAVTSEKFHRESVAPAHAADHSVVAVEAGLYTGQESDAGGERKQ